MVIAYFWCGHITKIHSQSDLVVRNKNGWFPYGNENFKEDIRRGLGDWVIGSPLCYFAPSRRKEPQFCPF